MFQPDVHILEGHQGSHLGGGEDGINDRGVKFQWPTLFLERCEEVKERGRLCVGYGVGGYGEGGGLVCEFGVRKGIG